MSGKPMIAITMEDPAGIGPEIIVKLIECGKVFSWCRLLIVGDSGYLKKIVAGLHLSFQSARYHHPS